MSVTIPDSVTLIGDDSFSNCTGLKQVDIGNGVTRIGDHAFENCTRLTQVTIGNSVTSIGGGAFYDCEGLTKVTIPKNVTSIGNSAFSHCEGLKQVNISDSVTSIGDYAFSNCTGLTQMTIGNSVTTIGAGAFESCESLTQVTIPDSVKDIGEYAFLDCSSLASVEIGSNVTRIPFKLFYGCESLEKIAVPDSVKSIVAQAFDGCNNLTKIAIGNGVTEIVTFALFGGCNKLAEITVGEKNPVYYSEGNCVIEKESKTLIVGCKNSIIPSGESVTSIGSFAFLSCKGLTNVTIPNSVITIHSFAFAGCTDLTNVTIPDSVTSIDGNAFNGCVGMTSIVLPQSVAKIESSAIPEYAVIYGYIGSYAQQWAEENNRAFVPIGDAAVTLNVAKMVNEPSVNVYGFANPGADVVCAVNGTETITVQASASGRWNAVIPLTGAKDGDSFAIKATVTVDGKTAEGTETVTYKPDAIVFQEFTLNHSCYSVNIKDEKMGVSVPNFTFFPDNPLAFRIKVSNSDRVEKLFVISTKDGDSRQMELTYDADSGYWFANGYFDNSDENYVPGVFTVKGTDKDGKEFDAGVTIKINFLIDPSGYAYEAVTSNKLEGVTAAVYYKNAQGHELLWNAETADQLNPIKTLSDGAFAWVVPEGKWQVRLTKDGYRQAVSEWMDVPPEYTNVYIPMVSTVVPGVAYVNVYADRAEITFSQYMEIESVNMNSVKFNGYTGTIAPIDKTETASGSGVFYAKAFTFTPEKAFSGEVAVAVANAKNYAGKEMASPYSATFTVAAEPKNLTATQDVSAVYGKTAEVTVSAENAAGKTVSVACDSANVTLSDKTLTLDETGKATLSVTGEMPGVANLTFALDGTTLKAAAKVSVTVPEVPAEPEQPTDPENPATPTDPENPATPTDPEGPDQPTYALGDVDGDGEVTSGDARLALRASVQLEKYEPGSAAFLAADADKNGEIESSDARTILRVSVKLETF